MSASQNGILQLPKYSTHTHCSECGNIDTQGHILWCPFHAHLREGKSLDSDSDLVEYMKKVFIIREELRTKDL